MADQAFTVEEFAAVYKVGRTTAFHEIAVGRLVTYKVGRRRYISAHAAADWQRRLEDEQTTQALRATGGTGGASALARLPAT